MDIFFSVRKAAISVWELFSPLQLSWRILVRGIWLSEADVVSEEASEDERDARAVL